MQLSAAPGSRRVSTPNAGLLVTSKDMVDKILDIVLADSRSKWIDPVEMIGISLRMRFNIIYCVFFS